jgi:hypothetical protein
VDAAIEVLARLEDRPAAKPAGTESLPSVSEGPYVSGVEGQREVVVASGAIERPGRCQSVPSGKILLEPAAGAGAVHARNDLHVAKIPETRGDSDDEEGRYQHEVKPREEHAARGDDPEHARPFDRPREALTRRRTRHGHKDRARQRSEDRERRGEIDGSALGRFGPRRAAPSHRLMPGGLTRPPG